MQGNAFHTTTSAFTAYINGVCPNLSYKHLHGGHCGRDSYKHLHGGHCGRDRTLVRFSTIYAISVYRR